MGNERVVDQETHETGVLMIFNHLLETVSGMAALVMEVVALLLKIIGLVALLVLPETGVLMIFNHHRETVNGLVALVTEVVVRLGAFAAMIVNAVTVMISATRTGTDVSVQQDKAASQVPIVEMGKAVSGCAAKESANLAHYLKWL